MSDGQTHGERLEIKTGCRVSIGRSEVAHYPGEWSLEITDKRGDAVLLSNDCVGALRDFLNGLVAAPDRAAMLREAYALAKTQGDVENMIRAANALGGCL